ncbi:hypothetical protein DBV15_11438 [Temnothorax longispinosus]|uniref:Uncharacterized protein n=1 Tax=Temnothorax longispinosus TaxID=300112 RepID=A0A4S2KNH9_9HYME|nr:hypothetical protein DBV15_11438 [Temnothorax longispinosus]
MIALVFQGLPGGSFIIGHQTFRGMAHWRKPRVCQMPRATACFHGRAVLSTIVRVRGHSSATVPLSPTHGRRAAHEELRIREASGHGVEHRGPALRPADPQRERAEPSGRERARRRLLVGLACRGLPQGAPRVIRPILRSRAARSRP